MMSLNKMQGNNPLSKKNDKDINEQIDRLTEFYNALEDDTNMSYIIDKLDEIHDMQVFIKNQSVLLSEELHAFEKKWDEEIAYTDTAISKIRAEAIKSIRDVLVNEVVSDAEDIKINLHKIESDNIHKIRNITTQTIKKNR